MDTEECIILIILLLGFLYFLYNKQYYCTGNGFSVGGFKCTSLVKKGGDRKHQDVIFKNFLRDCGSVTSCGGNIDQTDISKLNQCRIDCNYNNLCKFEMATADEKLYFDNILSKKLKITRNNLMFRNPYDRTDIEDKEWGCVYIILNFYMDILNYFSYSNNCNHPQTHLISMKFESTDIEGEARNKTK